MSITQGDKFRVEVGEFLNDTLLEFGLRWVYRFILCKSEISIQEVIAYYESRHVLSQVTDARREETHVFNSFFYGKLSNKSKG